MARAGGVLRPASNFWMALTLYPDAADACDWVMPAAYLAARICWAGLDMGELIAENLRVKRKIYGFGKIILIGENWNFVDM
jgi:hypothetical protein